MTVSFVCRTESVLPREQLFDRARSIDAHVETMAASGERAVAGVTEGLISAGQEVTWRARHFGVPLTMTSRGAGPSSRRLVRIPGPAYTRAYRPFSAVPAQI